MVQAQRRRAQRDPASTSAKELMFIVWLVCRIMQNLLKGFPSKLVGGWGVGQERSQQTWEQIGIKGTTK